MREDCRKNQGKRNNLSLKLLFNKCSLKAHEYSDSGNFVNIGGVLPEPSCPEIAFLCEQGTRKWLHDFKITFEQIVKEIIQFSYMQQQDVGQDGRASLKLQISDEMPIVSVYFIHTCKSEILRDMQLNLFTILLNGHMYSLLLGIIKIVYLSFYDMSKLPLPILWLMGLKSSTAFSLDLC